MENFTQKEIEVLKYVCKGYTNEAIAQKLFVSIHTVKAHIASLLRKTGAANRTELVFLAAKSNWV